MKFAIQVNAAPCQGQASATAYRFVRAAVAKGHEVACVFFYHEAVYCALRTEGAAQPDAAPPSADWSALAREAGIDLVLCVSAALRRGIGGDPAAAGTAMPAAALADGFRIAGLGQLAAAAIEADRFLVFG